MFESERNVAGDPKAAAVTSKEQKKSKAKLIEENPFDEEQP